MSIKNAFLSILLICMLVSFVSAAGDKWKVSYGGKEKWADLNSSGFSISSLRFGDFNGDKKTDVFRTNGKDWFISYGGSGKWTRLNSSGYGIENIAFGDFNGDGKTDIFRSDGKKMVCLLEWDQAMGAI
jgi:hypothetical protein